MEDKSKKFVLWFDEVGRDDIPLVGGKNANLGEIGVASISTPPLPGGVVGPATITGTASAGGGTFSLAWTGGAVPANTTWVVRATKQVSPGRSFVKNLFRDIQLFAAADVTPTAIFANYTARFGGLVIGEKISVEVVAVSTITGIKSTPVSCEVIVAA